MKLPPGVAALALAAGLLAAPGAGWGHSSEFILARVTTPAPGQVRLEITADYGGNPLLTSEAEARAALEDLLVVRVGDSVRPLRLLAPLRFEKRTQLAADAPVPREPGDAAPHELLAAVWSWKADAPSIAFAVPAGSIHSVLLWKAEPAPVLTPQQARWAILLGGDTSPLIAVPPAPAISRWALAGCSLLGLVVVATPLLQRRLRRRRSP